MRERYVRAGIAAGIAGLALAATAHAATAGEPADFRYKAVTGKDGANSFAFWIGEEETTFQNGGEGVKGRYVS